MVHQRVRGFAFLVLLAVTVLLMAGKTQAAGSLDTSFGGDGIVTTAFGGNDVIITAMKRQTDGRQNGRRRVHERL
ncbi:MAG: hypothetical protein H6650_02215 [Ardenticatenales bacterium]|nr:hypothetical protein [Ardenticatenales bacterium]